MDGLHVPYHIEDLFPMLTWLAGWLGWSTGWLNRPKVHHRIFPSQDILLWRTEPTDGCWVIPRTEGIDLRGVVPGIQGLC